MDDTEDDVTLIDVEVAYATPAKQLIIALQVPTGTTAYEAARLSGIEKQFENINLDSDPMGIFSKVLDGKNRPSPNQYQLQSRDRVEIYRPLLIDPKQARLQRAGTARAKKSAIAKSSKSA